MTWTYVPRGSATNDLFPKVPGPIGVVAPAQMDVLKGYQFRGGSDDSLHAWLLLYPGKMSAFQPRTAPTADLDNVS